jgi:hypothetical protein
VAYIPSWLSRSVEMAPLVGSTSLVVPVSLVVEKSLGLGTERKLDRQFRPFLSRLRTGERALESFLSSWWCYVEQEEKKETMTCALDACYTV